MPAHFFFVVSALNFSKRFFRRLLLSIISRDHLAGSTKFIELDVAISTRLQLQLKTISYLITTLQKGFLNSFSIYRHAVAHEAHFF